MGGERDEVSVTEPYQQAFNIILIRSSIRHLFLSSPLVLTHSRALFVALVVSLYFSWLQMYWIEMTATGRMNLTSIRGNDDVYQCEVGSRVRKITHKHTSL